MNHSPPPIYHLLRHIESVIHLLKPPVGNQLLFGNGLKVMVVGGPNRREDFHINCGEELFYQVQGDLVLKVIVTNGVCKDIIIKEGELFVLPGNIPHSPQRFENTIGLVFERVRQPLEMDTLRWYMPSDYKNILYQESFFCEDLGVQLKPVIERFFNSDTYKYRRPDKLYSEVDVSSTVATVIPPPFNIASLLKQLVETNTSYTRIINQEFFVDVYSDGYEGEIEMDSSKEIFLWQLKGSTEVLLPSCPKYLLNTGDVSVFRRDAFQVEHMSKGVVKLASDSLLLAVSNKALV